MAWPSKGRTVSKRKDDAASRAIDIEQQRAYLQQILRGSKQALIIAVDENGELVSGYMNMNPIERRGIIELLGDTAPTFLPFFEDGDDED